MSDQAEMNKIDSQQEMYNPEKHSFVPLHLVYPVFSSERKRPYEESKENKPLYPPTKKARKNRISLNTKTKNVKVPNRFEASRTLFVSWLNRANCGLGPFQDFGTVTMSRIGDKYGFVEFDSSQEAQNAMFGLQERGKIRWAKFDLTVSDDPQEWTPDDTFQYLILTIDENRYHDLITAIYHSGVSGGQLVNFKEPDLRDFGLLDRKEQSIFLDLFHNSLSSGKIYI